MSALRQIVRHLSGLYTVLMTALVLTSSLQAQGLACVDASVTDTVIVGATLDTGAAILPGGFGGIPTTDPVGGPYALPGSSFDDLNSAASLSATGTLIDSLGVPITYYVFFFHTAADQWSANLYFDSADVDPASLLPGLPLSAGSALLTYTGDGVRNNNPAPGTFDITATVPWPNGSDPAFPVGFLFNVVQATGVTGFPAHAHNGVPLDRIASFPPVASVSSANETDIVVTISSNLSAAEPVLTNGAADIPDTSTGLVGFSNLLTFTAARDPIVVPGPSGGTRTLWMHYFRTAVNTYRANLYIDRTELANPPFPSGPELLGGVDLLFSSIGRRTNAPGGNSADFSADLQLSNSTVTERYHFVLAPITQLGGASLNCVVLVDLCPLDSTKRAPGLCGCGFAEGDADQDGTPDCYDYCEDDPAKIDEGTCGCGESDVDTDGDGVADCLDTCPNDDSKLEAGVCGCGESDADSDGDRVPDCQDDCPSDAEKLTAGTCGCGVADADLNQNGVADCLDPAPGFPPEFPIVQGKKKKAILTLQPVNGVATYDIQIKGRGNKRRIETSSPEVTVKKLKRGKAKVRYQILLGSGANQTSSAISPWVTFKIK